MPQRNKWLIPIAIIFAGGLIAFSLFLTTGQSNNSDPFAGDVSEVDVPGVGAEDHVLGNPEARIVFVEYSDFECPFCKEFHQTMHRIIDEYGPTGNVAWVYRHFPLEQLHSKAPREAEATECAADLGGNDGFWAYADRLFEVTPSNNGLDLAELPNIAEEVGLDRTAFEACLESGVNQSEVEDDFNEARSNAGARGTPHLVLIIGGEQIALEGSQPYSTLKEIIEAGLSSGVEAIN